MTQARMNWKRLTLDMDGHADAGPYGKDIVCAAESMLTQALLQTLIDLEADKRCGMQWTGSPEIGFLHVEAAPAEGQEETIRTCFRVTVTGLRMLAERYPNYINLEEDVENGNL